MDLVARDIMSTAVVACVPETKIEEVVHTLAEHEISGMPVIDAQRRVVGIVSEDDLLLADEIEAPRRKTALYGFYIMQNSVMERVAEQRGVRVEDVMTRKVVTFHPEDPVREIAKALHERKINRVPIVDQDGKLVGLVSRGDIVRALAERM